MTENNTKILLESYSPICPLVVIVEENICNTYMYLTKINIDNSELEDNSSGSDNINNDLLNDETSDDE